MNTISKINNVKNLQPANLKAGEPAASNGLYLQNPQYDAFTPSFKRTNTKSASSLLKKIALFTGTAAIALTNTQCVKVKIEAKFKFDNATLDAILTELQSMHSDNQQIKAMLEKMLVLQEYSNEISAENQALLAQIFTAVLQLQNNENANHDEMMELLNRMMDMVVQINNGIHQMDQHQAMAFRKLLRILMQMQGNQMQMINFMNQLMDMQGEIRDLLCIIVNNTETIGENQLNEYQLLIQMYQEIQQGNINLDAIYQLIQQFKDDQNMNAQAIIASIHALLRPLNAQLLQLQQIGQQLHDIGMTLEQLKNFIKNMALTIQAQMQEIIENQVNGQAIMQEWAQAIWEKIPVALNNCNCEDCCQQLIDILIQILQLLESGDWNHEGIDNQLDPLLGKAMRTWSQVIDEIGKGDNADSAKIEKLINEAKDIVKQIKSKPAQNPTFADILNS